MTGKEYFSKILLIATFKYTTYVNSMTPFQPLYTRFDGELPTEQPPFFTEEKKDF